MRNGTQRRKGEAMKTETRYDKPGVTPIGSTDPQHTPAPDLLTALKLAQVELRIAVDESGAPYGSAAVALKVVDAAIARAEGGGS